ncbi:MAG: hypothetical protein LBS38_00010 [Endomicrobium sp.]|jgi:hypothetical protein|nr:hypothetical protein [Endomicrobium sp.]
MHNLVLFAKATLKKGKEIGGDVCLCGQIGTVVGSVKKAMMNLQSGILA